MNASHARRSKFPDEDRLRADLYNYLGLMLAGPPDADAVGSNRRAHRR